MSRHLSTGATFKWLGDDLIADLVDYCACHGDMSVTWAIRKAVRDFLKNELGDKQKEAAFLEARRNRLGLESQSKVTLLPPRKK